MNGHTQIPASKGPVYMDYNATTPCDPGVLEAMLPWFSESFGNAASRQHAYGWRAAAAVEKAREEVAGLIGAEPGEIIFTSGSTEAVNLAIKGAMEAYSSKGRHMITCSTEHKAVLDTCHWLEKSGYRVTYLPVSSGGTIDLNQLEQAIHPDTVLIALMAANNETGVLHPWREIGNIAKQHQVLFFSDATQAVGKLPLHAHNDGIDLLCLSAHKLYGPKGIGALYLRRKQPRVRLIAQIHGGGHEKGLRSGTLNVPAIVGLGAACRLALTEGLEEAGGLDALRDELEQGLLNLGDVHINGDSQRRLAHVSNLQFARVNGKALLSAIASRLAVSAGSACTSASPEPSHVLTAMGLSEQAAAASLRFSLGKYSTRAQIQEALAIMKQAVEEQRSLFDTIHS